MKINTRVLLTVLAVLSVFGCGGIAHLGFPSASTKRFGHTDLQYLQQSYAAYNEQYFHNRLPKKIVIGLDEHSRMATTFCDDSDNCAIQFNLEFTEAPRVADLIMLHEMCHVKVWKTDVVTFGGHVELADHGRGWRGCMLQLDMQGIFRGILIDNYNPSEETH